jgi:hypothetical protein
MADLLGITIEEEIASVTREIGMRERVYPGWVKAKRMSQDRADRGGSMEIFAARPGCAPSLLGAIDIITRRDRIIARGEPSEFWCLNCWPWRTDDTRTHRTGPGEGARGG